MPITPQEEAATEQKLLAFIAEATNEEISSVFRPNGPVITMMLALKPETRVRVMVAKNIKLFGGVNEYVQDFLAKVVPAYKNMAAGPGKDAFKQGQVIALTEVLKQEGLSNDNKNAIQKVLSEVFVKQGGKRRKTRQRKTRQRKTRQRKTRRSTQGVRQKNY